MKKYSILILFLFLFLFSGLSFAQNSSIMDLDKMTDLDIYKLLIGFFLPGVVSWVNGLVLPGRANYFITFVVCVLVSFGEVWYSGKWNVGNASHSILLTLALTVGSYQIFWKPSGLADKIEGTPYMKKTILSLMLILPLFFLTSCTGTGGSIQFPQIPNTAINTLAMDAGYFIYRGVPDSRPILTSICVIKDLNNPELAAEQIRKALAEIWVKAEKITTKDAEIALLSIKNLVGSFDFFLLNTKDKVKYAEIVKLVIDGTCEGVELAAK